ncbi:MAG: DUF1592 domain-containing protein [Acidobacteria bacterium]|nr:DUF1592 domain-containing protein [Acidobacteriota bacterium]
MRAAWLLWMAVSAAGAEVTPFLATYCVSCHGAAVQMANRRFDRLAMPPKDDDAILLLQDIADQLTLGQMPPRAAPQPSEAQRRAAVESLTETIAAAHARRASTGGRTVMRRLNRREYLNTIGDLFQMNMAMFDPTGKFPKDQTARNMDNIGDTLITSGYLLEQYLDAAEQIVEKAFAAGRRPAEQQWHFKGNFRQQNELDYAHQEVYGLKYLCLYESPNSLTHEGAYGPLKAFSKGAPADGYYEIKVLAEGKNRRHPYGKLLSIDPEVPFRMGLVPGNEKAGPLHHNQPIEPQLGEVTVADDKPEWHTFRVWLDAGYTPRFTFPNGAVNGRGAWVAIIRRFKHTLTPEMQAKADPRIRPARPIVLRGGQMPHIRIHEVSIRGPLAEGSRPWIEFEASRVRELLEAFAAKAYRRPARAQEVDHLMAVYGRRLMDGRQPSDAFKDALKASLCAPGFLYLGNAAEGKPLDGYALASRLSYFLWSTMPDAELLGLARDGKLTQPDVRVAQMRRMLADARSGAFVTGFLDSWLNLRSLGDMPPDRGTFERYYAEDLEAAMKRETQMFTRYVLDQNEPVSRFLHADYAFVNKPLARLYGLPVNIAGADSHMLRKVRIDNPVRGGLLGQGSVLTVSANGVETSPVTRGVWMLENIFGTPPAPPPDNVPPIDPDVRGAKSMREILTKHRAGAACMSCHEKIDPPGFALENFDPIGVWRAKYENGIAIDGSGQLADGRAFQDVAGLKKILVERQAQFARLLTERLLTYACGRRMEPMDRPKVNALVRELGAKGYGFRDLMELVVASEVFRN